MFETLKHEVFIAYLSSTHDWRYGKRWQLGSHNYNRPARLPEGSTGTMPTLLALLTPLMPRLG